MEQSLWQFFGLTTRRKHKARQLLGARKLEAVIKLNGARSKQSTFKAAGVQNRTLPKGQWGFPENENRTSAHSSPIGILPMVRGGVPIGMI